MPLTNKQRAAIEAKAKEAGVDPARLLAEAESISSGQSAAPDTKGDSSRSVPSTEQPKLFMYLLPFVTVREVREVWLGLSDSFPGDDEVASAWAAKQGGGGSTPPDGTPQ